MRRFNSFAKAFDWTKEVIKNGTVTAEEVLAEQIYKDSNEFTYRETGAMYQSGANSNFKNGLITERTPYVRRRYFEGGRAGAGNRNAQPRWFEKTVAKYKKDYQIMAVKAIDVAKKG